MTTCDFTESWCYDPTGELADPCGHPAVGHCEACECSVCLEHGRVCHCGQIYCDSCRAEHESGCEELKFSEYERIRKSVEAMGR